LYDHETITNNQNVRLVAFGRYAGIVGAYNGFRTYGLKFNLFKLPKAEKLHDQLMLIHELQKLKLPSIKVILTGRGRVSSGSKEMLDGMGLREVSVEDFLTKTFEKPVYLQIGVMDYYKRKDGKVIDQFDFFRNPQLNTLHNPPTEDSSSPHAVQI